MNYHPGIRHDQGEGSFSNIVVLYPMVLNINQLLLRPTAVFRIKDGMIMNVYELRRPFV